MTLREFENLEWIRIQCVCGLTGGCELCNPAFLGVVYEFLMGWGLFKGLKIKDKDIEKAKKSLFPRSSS